MSDSLTLYRNIIDMILNTRVHFHDMRCLITFAWAIVGVLLEKSVHLSKWGVHRIGEAQAAAVRALAEEYQDCPCGDLQAFGANGLCGLGRAQD